MTLVEFLRARLDDDEADARGAWAPNWPDPLTWFVEEELIGRRDEHGEIDSFASAGSKADARHIARHDPARVLADVESKRRIMRLCEAGIDPQTSATPGVRAGYRAILRYLAEPYADHPDYDPEWRP